VIRFFLLLVALLACSDRDRSENAQARADQPRQRRVIEPPVGVVRALPPYAIRATGVGPYKLGERLSDLLDQLPSGPRVALFEVPDLLHRSLIRAEDNAVLIGGEPQSTATFVAVVGADVARTESGIRVGSKRAELVPALGPMLRLPDRAHDPRIEIHAGLKNARIIVDDDDRVSSITIVAEPAPAPAPAATAGECIRPASTDKAIGSCMTTTGELIEIGENEITMRAPGSDKVTPIRVPNVRFAVPLRMADGKDELVAVARTDEAQLRTWSLVAFRIEGGKLVKSIDPKVLYQVSSSTARWIGAEVNEVDLYLELWSRADSIEVGGLLTTRPNGGETRDVVVISTVSVAHKRGKPVAADTGSAETPDAGTATRDGSSSGSGEVANP
jgi:hypothetical protein